MEAGRLARYGRAEASFSGAYLSQASAPLSAWRGTRRVAMSKKLRMMGVPQLGWGRSCGAAWQAARRLFTGANWRVANPPQGDNLPHRAGDCLMGRHEIPEASVRDGNRAIVSGVGPASPHAASPAAPPGSQSDRQYDKRKRYRGRS